MLRRLAYCTLALIALALAASPADMQDKSKGDDKKDKGYSLDEMNKRITAALAWLKDHQNPEGYWSATTFSQDSKRGEAKKTHNLEWVNAGKADGDIGKGDHDIAWTGLAMLAFAGSGYDHKFGDYRTTVRLAVKWLRAMQDNDGCFGSGEVSSVHDHAVATMAICEVYGLSEDPVLKPMADKAVLYILKTQNEDGGWGSGKGGKESDTQVTGWCAMALKTALMAGLEFDRAKGWEGIHKWLDSVSGESKSDTRTGYKIAGDSPPRMVETQTWVAHPDMDAVNVVCRLFSGDEKWGMMKNKLLSGQVERIAKDPPAWADKKVDMAYWYFGSLAMFQFGGNEWKTWSAAMDKALLENQRGWRAEDKDSTAATLDEHGSWDAIGAWHPSGGRVWSTAMGALTLQIHARYKRLHGDD